MAVSVFDPTLLVGEVPDMLTRRTRVWNTQQPTYHPIYSSQDKYIKKDKYINKDKYVYKRKKIYKDEYIYKDKEKDKQYPFYDTLITITHLLYFVTSCATI